MELIEGEVLHYRWNDLTDQEKTHICSELASMVGALHRLKRPPGEEFIGVAKIFVEDLITYTTECMHLGAIGGQPSMDSLCFGQVSDPFPNSGAFYELFMRRPVSAREKAYKFGLPRLPYDSPIVFTHSDLQFTNILITPRGADEHPRVLAIIDWEQAGWMPSFWEYSKAKSWMMFEEVDKIGDQMERLPGITGYVPDEVFMAFATYMQAHGWP